MNRPFGTTILDTAFRYMVPFIMVYGVYVLLHGEYSPGGGFQAGALLAIAVVLTRLVQGREAVFDMKGDTAIILAGLGTLIYAGLGVLTVIWGGNFLDYAAIPLDLHAKELRPLGILVIEVGVTICVMGVIIAIYDALTRKDDDI